MADQPGGGVLERGGEPRPRAAPRAPRRPPPRARDTTPATWWPAGTPGWCPGPGPASAAAPGWCHSPGSAAGSASSAAPRPAFDPHLGHQHLLAPPVGLQVHRLDHRVLDPEHPPPYPRRAHAVPVFVSGRGTQKLKTGRRAPVIPPTIFTGGHPSNRGSGALRTLSGRPPACPQALPEGAAETYQGFGCQAPIC